MPFVHHINSPFIRVMPKNDRAKSPIDLTNDDEPVLFDIYNYSGTLVKSIRGTTNERIAKSKVVNTNVKYGFYILCEERTKINKIENKYDKIWKKDIKEKRDKMIEAVRKETNWKLRVLNERAKEREQMLKDAELLLEFSNKAKKEGEKNNKKNKKIENKEPTRRSSRLAKKYFEKKMSNCMGCVENQPNQMAHMGPNGCLGEEF
jgi:hypothetical protein